MPKKGNRNYHQNPEILHVGCEEPHAYMIPYQNNELALKDERTNSDWFESLCGEWDFHFYSSVEQVEDPVDPSIAQWDTIPVPMSWQMLSDRGYDKPFYDDTNYPIPVNPPYVPRMNPCGLYRKFFCVDRKTWEEEYVLCNAKNEKDGDLGYPATVELEDGSLLTVYYQKYEDDKKCSMLHTQWRLEQ